jgi:hypothetical protein
MAFALSPARPPRSAPRRDGRGVRSRPSSASKPNHCTLTTVQARPAGFPGTAALGVSCSSLLMSALRVFPLRQGRGCCLSRGDRYLGALLRSVLAAAVACLRVPALPRWSQWPGTLPAQPARPKGTPEHEAATGSKDRSVVKLLGQANALCLLVKLLAESVILRALSKQRTPRWP